jgi:hypothetical protein
MATRLWIFLGSIPLMRQNGLFRSQFFLQSSKVGLNDKGQNSNQKTEPSVAQLGGAVQALV